MSEYRCNCKLWAIVNAISLICAVLCAIALMRWFNRPIDLQTITRDLENSHGSR